VSHVSPREHRLGLAGMVLCTMLWSIAGLVTRHTAITNGFEVTFWRSLACAVCVAAYLAWRDGPRGVATSIVAAGWPGLVSGLMWAIMFTFFMLALTRTTVANTLVVSSLQPLFAALAGWLVLGERVPLRTWGAMVVAGGGIVVMFADAIGGGAVSGTLFALAVPVAAAANVILLKRTGSRVDFVPAVMVGGVISALVTLPVAWPLTASVHDVTLLGMLGAIQLALPCVFLAAWVVRRLTAAEVGLLALLEVLLGPILVWAALGERPSDLALVGSGIVFAALVANEAIGLVAERRTPAGGR